MTANRLDIEEGRVVTMEKLAGVLAKEGKSVQSEELYKQALLLSKNLGGSVEDNLRISTDYGALLRTLNKNEQADQLKIEVDATNLSPFEINHQADEEVSEVPKDPSPAHLIPLKTLVLASERLQKKDRLQQSLFYLGAVEVCCGQLRSAEAHFRKCSTIPKTEEDGGVRPKFKENMAVELTSIGCCLELQGKLAEAEGFYKRALDLDFEATCATVFQMASMALKGGKDEYCRVLSNRICTLADEANRNRKELQIIVDYLHGLSQQLREQGKHAPCVPLDKKALAIEEKISPSNSKQITESLHALGSDYRALHKLKEAIPLLERALAIHEKSSTTDHVTLSQALYSLGETHREQQDYDAAVPLYVRALSEARKANSPMVAPILSTLALTYRAMEKSAEAQIYYKQAIAIYEKTKGKDRELGGCFFGLGESCRGLRQYAEAGAIVQTSLTDLGSHRP